MSLASTSPRSPRPRPAAAAALLLAAFAGPAFPLEDPPVSAPEDVALPAGYLDPDAVREILDRTLVVRFAPDLSSLRPGERAAVPHLLRAGEVMHDLYEDQLHREALAARAALERLHVETGRTRRTADLLDLQRVFRGPIATTLDNQRVSFLPVSPRPAGKNVYPWGIEAADIPDPAGLLDPWTVVRRIGDGTLEADREALAAGGALRTLHPEVGERLDALVDAPAGTLYAVPYAVAYHRELAVARAELLAAAAALADEDRDFAQYLRLRATDLLTNDHEAGDAAWVTGSFGNLNAQIGAYESYDDALFGVKAFFSFSLLLRDAAQSEELRAGLASLQAVEDSLPYDRRKKVRDDIPVSVYRVIADFGQARGTNTATILPNDPDHARKYGRTILLRSNVMLDPEIFATARDLFTAVVAEEHHADLGIEGSFHRTLWHEVGHYLGPSTDRKGRDHGQTLRDLSDLFEELKSDLVSLHAQHLFHERGLIDDARLRSVQASGVLRVLQKVEPRREQPYQTMQLMQWNHFLAEGLLSFDAPSGRLRIDYSKYRAAVASMLREVIEIQDQGDRARAAAMVDRLAVWDPDLHGVCARAASASERYRYRLVRYGAMGE